MTCGIYLLRFNGIEDVYVGQSTNIEHRFACHISKIKTGKSNEKILEAYSKYGLPYLEILLECGKEELDLWENEAIDIFNSVQKGLNILGKSSATYITKYSGEYSNKNSKYSKEQIIDCFLKLLDNSKSMIEISEETGILIGNVRNIAGCKIHTWLEKEFPNEYNILKNNIGTRKLKAPSNTSKALGIVHPTLISPEGLEYNIKDSVRGFAREVGLLPNNLSDLLHGRRKSCKGWTIKKKSNLTKAA